MLLFFVSPKTRTGSTSAEDFRYGVLARQRLPITGGRTKGASDRVHRKKDKRKCLSGPVREKAETPKGVPSAWERTMGSSDRVQKKGQATMLVLFLVTRTGIEPMLPP